MRRKKLKPRASIGMTCVAGFDNKEVENSIDGFERHMKKLAKRYNLDISGLIWIYELKNLSPKKKRRYKK